MVPSLLTACVSALQPENTMHLQLITSLFLKGVISLGSVCLWPVRYAARDPSVYNSIEISTKSH